MVPGPATAPFASNKQIPIYSQNNSPPLCTFGGEEEETIRHLFWRCQISQRFWSELEQLLDVNCTHTSDLTVSEELILFGIKENLRTDKPIDLTMFILAKVYVYKCKLQSSMLTVFHNILQDRYNIERYSSFILGENADFTLQWLPYLTLIG